MVKTYVCGTCMIAFRDLNNINTSAVRKNLKVLNYQSQFPTDWCMIFNFRKIAFNVFKRNEEIIFALCFICVNNLF